MSRGRKGNDNHDQPMSDEIARHFMHTDEEIEKLAKRIESLEESRRTHNSRITGLERATGVRRR